MTTSLASFALVLLLAGTATAQQKQPRRSAGNKSPGITSSVDGGRSGTSATTPQQGAAGVAVGTGLTNDQQQGAASASNAPTKVDASSSIRTGASPVKARKKSPKSGN
jgi:hypothetical protein